MLSRALLIFILTTSKPVFILCPSWYHVPLPHPLAGQTHKLTFVHPKWIRNLNAIAGLGKNAYLCTGNGRKGSISRMSDEWKKMSDVRCQM